MKQWLLAIVLWLAYGSVIGISLAATGPRTAAIIFAVTGSIAYAALITLLLKLKV